MKTIAIAIDHVNGLVVFENSMRQKISLCVKELNAALDFALFCERGALTASALTRQQFMAKNPTIKINDVALACEDAREFRFIG